MEMDASELYFYFKVTFDYEEAQEKTKAVWRSTIKDNGAPFVMMVGI